MKRKRSVSLLWKMLIWLLLHLALLILVVISFGAWQWHSGLDALLRGPAGDRLRVAGEQMSSELSQKPMSQWASLMSAFASKHHVTCDVWMPHDEWVTHLLPQVPPEVMERIKKERRQGPGGQGARNSPRGGPRDMGGPPRGGAPEFDDLLDEEEREMRELLGPPPRGPRGEPRAAPRDGGFQPVKLIFFIKESQSGAYWVAMHTPLRGRTAPDHVVWLIRSDSLTGHGLFFDVKPWLFGAVVLLAVSFLFWVPFALHITRYVAKLKSAADDIAEGRFEVEIDADRRDELGSLGVAIQSMASRLDHLIKGQKRFLGDVAHELCSPLARLRTGLGILETRLPETEQARLSAIEEEARELAELIEEILAFSRASAGMKQVKGNVLALTDLVEETIAREAAQAHVERVIDPVLLVLADAKLLKRALGNLLRNAIRYAGENATIRIAAIAQGNQVRLSVSDDGPGVPEDEIEHIFEPFYRPDIARTRESGGAGLGLTIVKSCIEACGGSVFARNIQPSGFCVEIMLQTASV